MCHLRKAYYRGGGVISSLFYFVSDDIQAACCASALMRLTCVDFIERGKNRSRLYLLSQNNISIS
jgi:hypothetical protein